ncbi:unnamed protein product [Owenia fusiformis]|uniref:Uncharacterized protein n=1 Tax=Owenia fusiformis TaxID=6347 RepID=A0A8S4PUN5_OWEFU|nr:unnamed protein product [Owenia fusiformis]
MHKLTKKTRYLIRALGILSVSFSVPLIVIFLLFYTDPYQALGQFIRTTCTVQKSFYSSCPLLCKCPKHCERFFPCLVVVVQYEDRQNRLVQNASMFKDYFSYDLVKRRRSESFGEADGFLKHCSNTPKLCSASDSANNDTVREYQNINGMKDKELTCYYNPAVNRTETVLEITDAAFFVNVLFWSTLLLCIGITCLILGPGTFKRIYVPDFCPIDRGKDVGQKREVGGNMEENVWFTMADTTTANGMDNTGYTDSDNSERRPSIFA